MATANESTTSSFAGQIDRFWGSKQPFIGQGAGCEGCEGDGGPVAALAPALAPNTAEDQRRGALVACSAPIAKLSFAALPADQSVRLLAALWTSFQQLKGALHVRRAAARMACGEGGDVLRNYRAVQHRIKLVRSAKLIAKCSQQPDALVVHSSDVQAKIRHMTKYGSVGRAFYAIDVSAILAKFDHLRQLLPEVQPEIKAQMTGDDILVSLFHQLGAGFRVQSTADVELLATSYDHLRSAGFLANSEIHATPAGSHNNNNSGNGNSNGNSGKLQSFAWDVAPIRAPSHVKAALTSGIRTFLIDSVDEALRIHKAYQRLSLAGTEPLGFVVMVKRLTLGSQSNALLELYGAHHARFEQMAESLQRKNLQVVGLSLDFTAVQQHSEIKRAFVALQAAARVFEGSRFVALQGIDTALLQDHNNNSSSSNNSNGCRPSKFIEELRFRIRCFKTQHSKVKFTCDATRFLLKGTHTLTTRVIGCKVAYDMSGAELGHQYYIDDGCYGAFSRSVMPADARLGMTATQEEETRCTVTVLGATATTAVNTTTTTKTTIWGQTCDSVDMVLENAELPVLSTDCWLSFNDMEDACNTYCTQFNGFDRAERRYFLSLAPTA